MSMPLGDSILALLDTPDPADLGPHPRPGTLSARELNSRLDSAFSDAAPTGTAQQLIRSTILLWHDHLDASHTISQDLPSSDGSFLHGIMHRREPDYGNAKYWFNRVGQHVSYPEITRRATALLKQQGAETLLNDLVPNGRWDAFAMVDACEQAAGRRGTEEQRAVLRQIQRIEFQVLLERFTTQTV